MRNRWGVEQLGLIALMISELRRLGIIKVGKLRQPHFTILALAPVRYCEVVRQ